MSNLVKAVSQDDLLHLQSSHKQVEVEDGIVIDHYPVCHIQPVIVENLYHSLEKFVREHHLGAVFIEGLRYQLKGTPQHVLRAYIPMLSYLEAAHIPPDFDLLHGVMGAPDLAVEMALHGQSSNSSLLKKISRYMGAGSKEAWLILFNKHEVHQYFQNDFGVHVYKEGDVIQSPLFPGFNLAVHKIFAIKD